MSETYKAIEVRKPGEFAEVRRPLQDPGHDQVRIRVEACGVCHSDAATVEGDFSLASPIRVFPATKSSGALTRWDPAFAAGRSARGLALAFSPAPAVIASFAAAATL